MSAMMEQTIFSKLYGMFQKRVLAWPQNGCKVKSSLCEVVLVDHFSKFLQRRMLSLARMTYSLKCLRPLSVLRLMVLCT